MNKDYSIIDQMFKNALLNDKISHAFLLSALDNYVIDKEWKNLVKLLIEHHIEKKFKADLATYSDLVIIDGQNNLIKKEQILQAIKQLEQTSLNAKGPKILVILNLENANKQGLNSLLKFLEEPPEKTFLIFTTNQLAKILRTIKSRCQIWQLRGLSYEQLSQNLTSRYPHNHSLLAHLINHPKEAKKAEEEIIKWFKPFNHLLTTAIKQPNLFYPEAKKILTKDNYLILLKMYQVFLNDLWKNDLAEKTIFSPILITKYQNQNFAFASVLEKIDEFLSSQKQNFNFDLALAKMLTEIGTYYG